MRNPVSAAIAIFLALAIVYAVLIVAAYNVAQPFAQSVLVSIASAIFGSGLTFFLIRVFTGVERRK